MKDLTGKTAVVTGGASGIGLAMAQRFATAGMKLVLADVEEPALDAAVEALTSSGTETIGVVTDVSDIDSMRALGSAANDAFGSVHVLCNNAGVGGNRNGSGGTGIDLADWKWVLDVNLWGVVHGHSVFLDQMLAQGEGHIVNTASMAGQFPGHGAVFGVEVGGRRHHRRVVPPGPGHGGRCVLPLPWVGPDQDHRLGPQPAGVGGTQSTRR